MFSFIILFCKGIPFFAKQSLQSCQKSLRSEGLIAVKVSFMVFWSVIPCRFADDYYRFGGTYHFHLKRWRGIRRNFRVRMFRFNIQVINRNKWNDFPVFQVLLSCRKINFRVDYVSFLSTFSNPKSNNIKCRWLLCCCCHQGIKMSSLQKHV
jgi:hypothetical protein